MTKQKLAKAFSTIASSVKYRFSEQEKPGLCGAFLVGYLGHVYANARKKKERWNNVARMMEAYNKRVRELQARSQQNSKILSQALLTKDR